METKIHQYMPLEHEKRMAIPTNDAAYHLNRASQTLRAWASLGNGPIKPLRVNGRLAWSVKEIRNLLSKKECE